MSSIRGFLFLVGVGCSLLVRFGLGWLHRLRLSLCIPLPHTLKEYLSIDLLVLGSGLVFECLCVQWFVFLVLVIYLLIYVLISGGVVERLTCGFFSLAPYLKGQ